MRITVTATALCMAVVGLCTADDVAASMKQPTNIPAQPLALALQTLAKERNFQIVYVTEEIGDRRTGGVVGEYTPEEALQQLLSGTGLTYKFLDDKTITVVPLERASSTELPRQTRAESDFEGFESNTKQQDGQGSPWSRLRLAQATQGSAQSSNTLGPQDEQASQKAPDVLQEIVVTAQKRTENVQDVPISISVLNGAQLDESTVENLSDILNAVPGVTTIPSFQAGTAQTVMRGVTASGPLLEQSSTVAYYIDAVPFGMVRSAINPDPNPYDVNHVEVLRGPQGTLYGANALDGVIRVLTNDPDLNRFDFKARTVVSGTQDGGANGGVDAAVNVPIIDGKLAARAVVGESTWSGWINSLDQRHVNNADLENYRLKLGAQPTDDLSIVLAAWRSDNYFGAPQSADDNNQNLSVNRQPLNNIYDAYSAKIVYDAHAFSVTSMSSYLDYKIDGYLDLSRPGFGVNGDLNTRLGSKVLAQEVDLASEGSGPWRWTAGGFYRHDEDLFMQYLNLAPDVLTPEILRYDLADKSKSYAAYGELTRQLFSNFELTLGFRYFHDDVTTEALQQIAGEPFIPLTPMGGPDHATTPRVVIAWHPDRDLTVYGSYSKGFRSGVPQSELVTFSVPDIPPAKPDILTNYEIGAKGDLFNRRVSFDTAFYYVSWNRIQETLDVVGQYNIIAPATVNGTSASGTGFDGSLKARLLDGLTAGIDFSWNSLHQDSAIYSAGLLLFSKGQRLAFSPEFTGGASLDYAFALGGSGFLGRLSAAANFISSMTQNELSGNTVLWSRGDDMVNVRTSFVIDASEHWSAMLFVDNLTNDRGTPEIYQPTVPTLDARVRPRTFGLQLDYHFR